MRAHFGLLLLAALSFEALALGDAACSVDTGGTCTLLPCSPKRGPTSCTRVNFFVHKCSCQPGYCANEGICKLAGGAGPTPAPAPMPLPGPPTDQCDQAYAHGCYAKTPFKGCCHDGQCQAGHDEVKCTWGFEMPCCKDIFDPKFTTFIFDVGSETDCQAACNALGDSSNNYLDYCPGGKLSGVVGRCPAALKSLEQAFVTKSWCSSHREMTCDWTYSFFNKDAGKELTASASFNFQGSSDKCVTACGALGLGSNSPEWYCSDTPLSQAVSGCPEAKASFDSAHGTWCKTGEISLVQASGRHEIIPAVQELGPAAVRALAPNRSLRSSAALSALAQDSYDYDRECHEAFQAGCWDKKPFTDCCSDSCASASFSHTCDWSFTYSSEPTISGKLSAFKGEPWVGCDHACEVLGNSSNSPQDYCGDKKTLLARIQGCHQAEASLEKTHATWCKTLAAEAMPSLLGQPRLGTVAATAAAAAAAMAAAALAVKLRAQRLVGEEGHQPLMG